jgi:hypothetical protein
MKKPHSVKYTRKDQWLELLIEPIAFKDIVCTFGKNQLMFIDQLHLFQKTENKVGDYDYNEDFFMGIDITLDQFQEFLNIIGNHIIYYMVFEIEDGTCFKIEDSMVTISVKHSNEKKLTEALTFFTSAQETASYQKVMKNQGRYIYFKKTQNVQILTNNELWNKFEACVN